MTKTPTEINENEIRIIVSDNIQDIRKVKKYSLRSWILTIIGVLILVFLVFKFSFTQNQDTEEEKDDFIELSESITDNETLATKEETITDVNKFTIALDTTVNTKGLLILYPENAQPRLIIGTEMLNDSNIILATQAADVRGDNGQIAGAFVLNGELISKGEAKAGYCSIIDGELSIGIADATPMLEQTLTDGGYFFRQYPLVVGGQIVENKPKGKAIRKALAEIDGKIYVVMSKEKLTFHDFSRLLIDAGTRNAIYLVGSSSYGFYKTENGKRIQTGLDTNSSYENVNFIVWQ